jgi:hypothetical protein
MRRRTALALLTAAIATPAVARRTEPWRLGRRLHVDDFRSLDQWSVEAERPAVLRVQDGVLEIDTPAGLTAWFRPKLEGPLAIEYEALMVSAGGPNDRVSDLNAFWMADDVRSPGALLARPRTGAFADYDLLRTYYVGQGGNANTSTRFRRYVGRVGERPLLPQHDLAAREHLLTPNRWQAVRLVACGALIQYWRDGMKVFELHDPEPYTAGWFAVRTTFSHLKVRRLRIRRLEPR